MNDNHGKVIDYARCCRVHGEHGPLYPCPEYDEDTLLEIAEQSYLLRQNLNDPDWCRRQMESCGIPPIGMEILKALAGVGGEDE